MGYVFGKMGPAREPLAPPAPPDLAALESVRPILAGEGKVAAIKAYREKTGTGLREAKLAGAHFQSVANGSRRRDRGFVQRDQRVDGEDLAALVQIGDIQRHLGVFHPERHVGSDREHEQHAASRSIRERCQVRAGRVHESLGPRRRIVGNPYSEPRRPTGQRLLRETGICVAYRIATTAARARSSGQGQELQDERKGTHRNRLGSGHLTSWATFDAVRARIRSAWAENSSSDPGFVFS